MSAKQPITPRAELKLRARQRMGGTNFAPTATLGAAVVVLTLLLEWFYMRSGAAINLYYWSTAGSDIQSSFSLSGDGLFAALRVEEMGAGFSVAVTAEGLLKFLLVQLAMTVAAAPLYLGALDNLWAIYRAEARPFRTVLRWYTDLRRAGRAIVMQLVLQIVSTGLTVVFAVPGLLVLRGSGGEMTMVSLGLWLVVAARAAAWCCMTQLMPAKFLLARDCDKGVLAAFKDGWALLKGRHREYLYLWLSFALWEIVNGLTRNMMSLYLFPYEGFTNMEWMTECGGLQREENVPVAHF